MEDRIGLQLVIASTQADLLGAVLALVFVLLLIGTAAFVVARVVQSGQEDDLRRRVIALEYEVESIREELDAKR